MKRILSLLLVLALVFSMVACGNNNSNNTNTTDNTSNNMTNESTNTGSNDTTTEEPTTSTLKATISVQAESGWMDYYEAAKARVLEMYPDSTINIIETGSFDHLDVLDGTDLTNEDVADVFAIPADRLAGLSKNEVLASIDAQAIAAKVGGFANYDAGLGGNFNVDGSYLAFPMNIETLIIFANTANAAAAGLDLTGTLEFTELGYEDMLIPAFNAWFGVAMTNSANIELLGKDGASFFSTMTNDFADLTQEQQDFFTAMFNYWKAHDEAGTDLWDSSAAWGYMDSAFTTGGTNTLRLEGPWSTGSLSEKAGNGEDLAILPINQVTINGQPLAHWKGGWGLAVNARIEENADQMELAAAMIAEIVNTDYAVDFFKATGKILENVSADTYANSDLSDTDKTVIAAVLESYAGAPNRPLFAEWGSVWDTWQNSVLSWASVKPATPEAAYAELKAAFDAMMMNY
ncbi:MAG: sugar ABC transporter substrate-binding protein [Clostridia bacterium]|nr:sugar ABC transporter substrate-binding protein [Clostridia bacterium]